MSRLIFIFLSIPLFVMGIGLLSGNQWYTAHWLWPQAPWYSFYFMASLFFANATALLFCAFNKEIRAIISVSMGSLVCCVGIGLYLLLQAHEANQLYDKARLLIWGDLAILYSIFYAIFLLAYWRTEFVQANRLPLSLQFILGFIVAINLWVGLRLIGIEDAFAWKLTSQMAVIYGWGLLGAAIFTASVMLEPFWENVTTLFAAFVAYNLTLFYPLIALLIHAHNEEISFDRTVVFFILIILTLLMVIFYSLYRYQKFVGNK